MRVRGGERRSESKMRRSECKMRRRGGCPTLLGKRREFRDSPKLSGSGAMLTNIRLQRGQGEEFQSHPIIVL